MGVLLASFAVFVSFAVFDSCVVGCVARAAGLRVSREDVVQHDPPVIVCRAFVSVLVIVYFVVLLQCFSIARCFSFSLLLTASVICFAVSCLLCCHSLRHTRTRTHTKVSRVNAMCVCAVRGRRFGLVPVVPADSFSLASLGL